jgi:hypothetical protein
MLPGIENEWKNFNPSLFLPTHFLARLTVTKQTAGYTRKKFYIAGPKTCKISFSI